MKNIVFLYNVLSKKTSQIIIKILIVKPQIGINIIPLHIYKRYKFSVAFFIYFTETVMLPEAFQTFHYFLKMF